jgi:hypothetical protein
MGLVRGSELAVYRVVLRLRDMGMRLVIIRS